MYEMLNNIKGIEQLAQSRTTDLSEPVDQYLAVAAEMQQTGQPHYISRAQFILEQIDGNTGKEIFEQYCEDWEVWKFPEQILTAEDFKRGFLWLFRDHTTSWAANDKAKGWFLSSPEAFFVRRYELWSCDNGYDECIEVREGSYKEILNSLLLDGYYAVLASPVFSKSELDEFIKAFEPSEGDFSIQEIIEEYISCNPNYEE